MGLLHVEYGKNRIFGLDVIRALAIIFVMISHGAALLPKGIVQTMMWRVDFNEVTIFFVLSGYLIGNILIRDIENKGSSFAVLRVFLVRRWFRTLPNYFLLLFFVLGLQVSLWGGISFAEIKSYFVFSQNLFSSHPHFFPEVWSLSVEEWFYLIVPLFTFILIKVFQLSIKNSVFVVAVVVLVSATLYRYRLFDSLQITTIGEWDLLFRK
jgi:peptidoglycan/LPS O-acetylase OafA/YrhL